MTSHTVEKVGGTSMSRVPEVIDNVFLSTPEDPYHRIFVVSAYGGITDMLLEHKHSGDPGVYALFNESDEEDLWQDALAKVADRQVELNAQIFADHEDNRRRADAFVRERIAEVRQALLDLQSLCSFGHFRMDQHLDTVREMLAAVGEAHSAHNTVLILQSRGCNASFIDLTGWKESDVLPLEEHLHRKLDGLALDRELPIVTGYAKCAEGLMKSYDRGYSELVFSRIAAITGASEAIIHKEYHLSSADPRLVGEDKAVPIGRTNYDVADQLAILGMEAIHPGAAQALRKSDIPLRVRHSFEPDHAGTLIDADYSSETPRVEIIAGKRGVFALEVFNHEMLEHEGHALQIQKTMDRYKVRTVLRESNANTITYYLSTTSKNIKRITRDLEEIFPAAEVSVRKVAVISAIGSNLRVLGLLSQCVSALAEAGVSILAVQQSLRAIDIRFVVTEQDFDRSVVALHREAIEAEGYEHAVGRVA